VKTVFDDKRLPFLPTVDGDDPLWVAHDYKDLLGVERFGAFLR
jgi:hypothetical protein